MAQKIWDFLFKEKAAFWTAVFTGVLSVFTVMLYSVSRDANEASTDTQRAFISVAGNPGFQNVVIDGKLIGFAAQDAWVNSGTTPTRSAVEQFNVSQSDERPGPSFDFERLPQAETQEYVLGPKAFWQVSPVQVSLDEIEALQKGKHLFAWGWVVYHDIFKGTPPRLSEFCFEITDPRWPDPKDHTKPGPVSLNQTPCQTHNCYDERCEDYTKRTSGQ